MFYRTYSIFSFLFLPTLFYFFLVFFFLADQELSHQQLRLLHCCSHSPVKSLKSNCRFHGFHYPTQGLSLIGPFTP